jgi:hypothetical protein
MKNKTIANWIIGSLSLTFFNAWFIEPSDPVLADTLYLVAGLMFVVFGIMAVVRLYKLEK